MDYREVLTVGDLLVRGAEESPETAVVVCGEERATYAELLASARETARSLHALGVRHGDRVGLLMPNALRYLEVWFGAMVLGAVVVPVNSRFRSVELGHVIPDAEVQIMVVQDAEEVSFVDRFLEAFPELAEMGESGGIRPLDFKAAPKLRHVLDISARPRDGLMSWERFVSLGADVPDHVVDQAAARVRVRSPAVRFYTSGTTALPKGCILTHEAMTRQGRETAERLALRRGEVMLSPLPMFHTGHTQVFYAVLERRGTYVTMPVFDADNGLPLIRQERPTVWFTAFPAITNGLVDHPAMTTEDLEGVRVVFSVAPPAQLGELEDKLPGARVVTGFGMTELAGSLAISDPEDPRDLRLKPGRPLRGSEVEIRDIATDLDVPEGVEGQIFARGPTLFSGYHGKDEETATSFDENGWFATGDLGAIDENGLLDFRGRVKDMLKVGGENVAALEVESYIMSHPAVAMVSVVGVADDTYGEVPVAYVEVQTGMDLTEDEVIAHCQGAIASFKVPRHVRFVTEWPMSATKIRKVELRRWIADELTSDSA